MYRQKYRNAQQSEFLFFYTCEIPTFLCEIVFRCVVVYLYFKNDWRVRESLNLKLPPIIMVKVQFLIEF